MPCIGTFGLAARCCAARREDFVALPIAGDAMKFCEACEAGRKCEAFKAYSASRASVDCQAESSAEVRPLSGCGRCKVEIAERKSIPGLVRGRVVR